METFLVLGGVAALCSKGKRKVYFGLFRAHRDLEWDQRLWAIHEWVGSEQGSPRKSVGNDGQICG